MELSPGTRVIITQTAYNHESSTWYNADVVDAVPGSIARILSDIEYREIYDNHRDRIIRDHYVRDDPEYVESQRKYGAQCALVFETVEPFMVKTGSISCAVGRVIVLERRFFQKFDQKPVC